MTKYISDVKTVEEAGTTGIRITVSEDIGETSIRAVNTIEFENIQSEIKKLQENGVTTDTLEEYVNKIKINANTLDSHPASDFAKTSDLQGYAKTTDLNNYSKTSETLWVGRIKSTTSSSDNWNYNNIEGMHNNTINFNGENVAHGFCLVIRPGGFDTDTSLGVPVQILGFKDGALYRYSYGTRPSYIKTITWKDSDGTSITEECLVCPVNLGWTDINDGQITFNYRGRAITRIWKYQ